MQTDTAHTTIGFIGLRKMGSPTARRLIEGGSRVLLHYGGNMEITYKDISLLMQEAERLGVTLLLGSTARQMWGCGVHRGGAKRDTLITSLEEWAGVEVEGRSARGKP